MTTQVNCMFMVQKMSKHCKRLTQYFQSEIYLDRYTFFDFFKNILKERLDSINKSPNDTNQLLNNNYNEKLTSPS